ncbi:MAG: glycosyltransferase family 2 protein [Candidatus Atabeyarchaeum deiterrae]
MPQLSVIVTTKNNAYTIGPCLERILKAPPKDKELVIVYGKSKDGTEEIVKSYRRKARILFDDVSTGSAINTGVLNSSGKIIVYVEDHSFISEDAFLLILKAFNSNPDIGYIVFHHYFPENVKGLSLAQKLMNLWRSDIRNATLGQFRGFRRKTFFDVGGFWVFPKGVDDLEFATRMSDTKWKMMVLDTKSWDLPRRSLRPMLGHQVFTGESESCWFHVYHNHPYARKEYRVKKNTSHPITTILLNMVWGRLVYTSIHGLKVALNKRFLSFFPFYALCNWCYVYGFFKAKLRSWGKEKWDPRVRQSF